MTETEFAELTSAVEELSRNQSSAIGARDEIRKRLQAEFKCKNLDEAKQALKKIVDEINVTEPQIRKKLEALKKQCPKLFD